MLSSHPKSLRCDIGKGFITCFATLIAACSFGVGVWVYSLVSSPFTYTYECLCVFIKKKKEKRFSVLSRRPTSVLYDIEKGFPTCSTLTAACRFGVALWVYYLVSSPFPYIICFCVCLTKKKRKTEHSVLSSRPTSVMSDIEEGFITCSETLTAACIFGVGMRVHSLVSSTFLEIFCVCVCVR